MPDERLATILGLMDTHQAIRGHMKVVMDHVNTFEMTLGLDQLQVKLTAERRIALNQTRQGLEQTLAYLDEGLQKQIDHESRVLPPMVCELLMKAMGLDHIKIMEQIKLARSMVNIDIERLQPDLISTKWLEFKHTIEYIRQTIEAHTNREDVVLSMLKEALEAEPVSAHVEPRF